MSNIVTFKPNGYGLQKEALAGMMSESMIWEQFKGDFIQKYDDMERKHKVGNQDYWYRNTNIDDKMKWDSPHKKFLKNLGFSQTEFNKMNEAWDEPKVKHIWMKWSLTKVTKDSESFRRTYTALKARLDGKNITKAIVKVTATYWNGTRPTIKTHKMMGKHTTYADLAQVPEPLQYSIGYSVAYLQDRSIYQATEIELYDDLNVRVDMDREERAVLALLSLTDWAGTALDTTVDLPQLPFDTLGQSTPTQAISEYDLTNVIDYSDPLAIGLDRWDVQTIFQEADEDDVIQSFTPKLLKIRNVWADVWWSSIQNDTIDTNYITNGMFRGDSNNMSMGRTNMIERVTKDEFSFWIGETLNIDVQLKDNRWWEDVLDVIGDVFEGIGDILYYLLKLDPFWWAVDYYTKKWYWEKKYPDMSSNDVKANQKRIAGAAISIVVSIVISVLTWGSTTGITVGLIAEFGAVAVASMAVVAFSVFIAEVLLLALNVGLMAYTGYVQLTGLLESIDMEQLQEDMVAMLSEHENDLKDQATEADLGTQGSVSNLESEMAIMYDGMFNETFNISLGHSPFDKGDYYDIDKELRFG